MALQDVWQDPDRLGRPLRRDGAFLFGLLLALSGSITSLGSANYRPMSGTKLHSYQPTAVQNTASPHGLSASAANRLSSGGASPTYR